MTKLKDFAHLLSYHCQRENRREHILAKLINDRFGEATISSPTIRNWRAGSTKRVRNWWQLVAVAVTLNLTYEDANELVQAAGLPDLYTLVSKFCERGNKLQERIVAAYLPKIPEQLPERPFHFVGRESATEWLHHRLQTGEVVTVCGAGGMGKTALISNALWQLQERDALTERFPDGIIFHSFYDQPQTTAVLAHIAFSYREKPVPTTHSAAQRVLANKKALLVLDGAEDAENLEAILKIRGKCGVLITSRRRQDAYQELLDLTPLTATDASDLLTRWGASLITDKRATAEIGTLVGHLPLALELVGRYLKRTAETDIEYLEWLRQTTLKALDHGNRQHQSIPLLLAHSLKQTGRGSQELLSVIGQLARASFSAKVLEAGLEETAVNIKQILGQFVNYGLLLREAGRYRVSHALIHAYAREQLPASAGLQSRLYRFYELFIQNRTKIGPQGYEDLNLEWGQLNHYLETLATTEQWNRYLRNLQQLAAIDLGILGYLDTRGHWELAINLLNQAKPYLSRLEDNLLKANTFLRLGTFSLRQARYELAEEYLEKALQILSAMPASEQSILPLAYTYDALAELAINTDPEQALPLATIGVKALQRVETEQTVRQLGYLYIRYATTAGRMGDLDEAEKHVRLGLSSLPKEPSSARVSGHMTLGNIYGIKGEVAQASAQFQLAVNEARKLGDQRRLAGLWRNLGIIAERQGRYEDCLAYQKKGLNLYRRIGDRDGEGHLAVNIGFTLLTLGEDQSATTYLETAVSIATHNKQLLPIEAFANLHRIQLKLYEGDLDAAEQLLARTTQLCQQFQLAHYEAPRLRLHAKLQMQREQPENALPLIEKSLATAISQKDVYQEGISWRIKGIVLKMMRQDESALSALEKSAHIFEADEPLERAKTEFALAQFYLDKDRGKAKELFQNARGIFNRLGAKRELALVKQLEKSK